MNPTQFTYATNEEIFALLPSIFSLTIGERLLFGVMIVVLFVTIFYVIPFFIVTKSYIFSERERLKKKSMLQQIMLQKQIEEEVEREIKEEETRQTK